MTQDEKRRQKKLAKKAAKRKTKSARKQYEPFAPMPGHGQIIGYEITEEPLPNPTYNRLPQSVKDQLTTLYDLIFKKPKKALVILEPLREQYPDLPQIYNYLYIAYRRRGDPENAQRVLQETLKRFPDYLFGRIQYATEYLQRGEYEKVPEIFEEQFDLKLLYPKRKRFHISEVLGFYSVMAWYFHAQGEFDLAESYFQLMQELDPEDPKTRLVKKLLHPSWFTVMLRKLLKKP